MNSEIEQFCEKHVFSKKRINNVLLIIEEFLAINNATAEKIDINLTLSYAEKHDTLEIIFDSIGPEGNIIENTDPDELGITIIKNLTNSIEYQRSGERNIICMSLLRA
jgi:polar amino acid transport system ATP-binding protein